MSLSSAFKVLNFLNDKDRVDHNALSLTRSTAFWVTIWLTIAFLYMAYKGQISQWMFVTYPAGVCLCFAPALFTKVVKDINKE